jgi:hypothetical protein
MSSKYPFKNESLMDHGSVVISTNKSTEVVDFNSKPRTALFKGREDDEPMAPQVNITTPVDLSGKNMENAYFTKLGVFLFHVRQNVSKKWELTCTEIISSKKLIFVGINLLKKLEEKEERN